MKNTVQKNVSSHRITRGIASLAVGLALLLQCGCAAFLIGGGAVAGAGGYAYASGELKSTQGAPLDKVWGATQVAMKDLGYTPSTEAKDAFKGQLIARTAENKKISLHFKRLSDNSTEIRIRVGVFGDEGLSRLILEKTEKELS